LAGNCVTYDENDEIRGVRYMQLTAVNARAIQQLNEIMQDKPAEQQREIDELKAEIRDLSHKQ
jgi:hypothetical protein